MRDFLLGSSSTPLQADRLADELLRRLQTGPAIGDGELLFDGMARLLKEVSRIDGEEWRAARLSLRDCLSKLVTTVPPHYASALVAVEVERRKVREFAEQAGLSITNGGVRLYRARLALRARFRAALFLCDIHGSRLCACEPKRV